MISRSQGFPDYTVFVKVGRDFPRGGGHFVELPSSSELRIQQQMQAEEEEDGTSSDDSDGGNDDDEDGSRLRAAITRIRRLKSQCNKKQEVSLIGHGRMTV